MVMTVLLMLCFCYDSRLLLLLLPTVVLRKHKYLLFSENQTVLCVFLENFACVSNYYYFFLNFDVLFCPFLKHQHDDISISPIFTDPSVYPSFLERERHKHSVCVHVLVCVYNTLYTQPNMCDVDGGNWKPIEVEREILIIIWLVSVIVSSAPFNSCVILNIF